MKQPNRARVIERAVLIATVARDMESCEEHFALYSSVVFVLERNSEGYSILRLSPSVLNLLGRIITGTWCMAEAMLSPFTTSELREAIADTMRLAKKELCKEDSNLLGKVIEAMEACAEADELTASELTDCGYDYSVNDTPLELQLLAISNPLQIQGSIDEWIIAAIDDGEQITGAFELMEKEDPKSYNALLEILYQYIGMKGVSYAI